MLRSPARPLARSPARRFAMNVVCGRSPDRRRSPIGQRGFWRESALCLRTFFSPLSLLLLHLPFSTLISHILRRHGHADAPVDCACPHQHAARPDPGLPQRCALRSPSSFVSASREPSQPLLCPLPAEFRRRQKEGLLHPDVSGRQRRRADLGRAHRRCCFLSNHALCFAWPFAFSVPPSAPPFLSPSLLLSIACEATLFHERRSTLQTSMALSSRGRASVSLLQLTFHLFLIPCPFFPLPFGAFPPSLPFLTPRRHGSSRCRTLRRRLAAEARRSMH